MSLDEHQDAPPSTAKVYRYLDGLIHTFVRTKVQPSDPFPIERCSRRLKSVLLTEFQGRCPTLQEILSIPHRKWLTLPGMGHALAMELNTILQGQNAGPEGDTPKLSTDAEFLSGIERLRGDLLRLRHDIQVLMSKLPVREAGPDAPTQSGFSADQERS